MAKGNGKNGNGQSGNDAKDGSADALPAVKKALGL